VAPYYCRGLKYEVISMPRLEKISITGFKNLKNFEVTDLKKINYFIGASGAGKSSVFELLTMLFRGRTRADV
jgi:predicted ATPase